MKKILFTLGIIGLLMAAACDTPQPTTNSPAGDSTVNSDTTMNNNTTTQPDSTMNRPDSTQNH